MKNYGPPKGEHPGRARSAVQGPVRSFVNACE